MIMTMAIVNGKKQKEMEEKKTVLIPHKQSTSPSLRLEEKDIEDEFMEKVQRGLKSSEAKQHCSPGMQTSPAVCLDTTH
ncbi:hypothetical protein P7K49_008339 [Saguinus oedipus]|uniref:Uncharacterized protein n=1 Tax=Saguinus oedipus TaxID=9490 RepID=A0ABQ9VXF2_SAGOE|nr:hypothetical protein P7K49_008339 [Saguinus oedipus]